MVAIKKKSLLKVISFLASIIFIFILSLGCKKNLDLKFITLPKDSVKINNRVFITLDNNYNLDLIVNGHNLYNYYYFLNNRVCLDSVLNNADTCRITLEKTGLDSNFKVIHGKILDSRRIDQIVKKGHWNIVVYYNQSTNKFNYSIFSADPPPPAAGHFKIRLSNFYKGLPGAGNIHAIFPDGTSAGFTPAEIPFGTTSDYLELPSGSYQFFILDQNNKIIDNFFNPIYANSDNSFPLVNIYIPFRPYVNGGIYNIFVSSDYGNSNYNNSGPSNIFLENQYNLTQNTGKLQIFNAYTGSKINYSILQFSGSLANLGDRSPILNIPSGTQNSITLTTTNDSLQLNQTIIPSDNYTQFVYQSDTVQKKIKSINLLNDFSYTYNKLYDGSYGDGYFSPFDGSIWEIEVRFLNFCTDCGPVTFIGTDLYKNTGKISTNTSGTYSVTADSTLSGNLPYANFLSFAGNYISFGADLQAGVGIPIQIKVFKTKPDSTLGDRIKNLQLNYPFVEDKSKYQKSGKKIPAAESGLYTILLLGKMNVPTTSKEAVKLVVLKHSK